MVGHTEELTQFLNIEVLQWYHPILWISHRKNAKGLATRVHEHFVDSDLLLP
jgi:hypothetical protein